MNRMKYLTSILGVAVLMVVVAACGSGSSVNTVTPPASAVQPDDQLQASGSTPELDISQVIQMAQSGQLDEIEVSGDSLKVTTTDGQVVDPQTPVTPPAPDLTHGSPPALSGAPLASLKFDGVDYVHSRSAELPSGEGALFVIDGIEVNVTNLELVGTTTEGRTAGIDQGLEIYRSHIAGDADAVYTFTPGKSWVNPEDGQIFEFPAEWTRWTATDR